MEIVLILIDQLVGFSNMSDDKHINVNPTYRILNTYVAMKTTQFSPKL